MTKLEPMQRFFIQTFSRNVLLLLGLSLFLCSCENAKPQSALVFNLGADPGNLHPQLAVTQSHQSLMRQMGEGLTRVDPHGLVRCALAKEIQALDGTVHWKVSLREDTYWSNGDRIVVEDFMRAWKAVLTKEVKSPLAELFFCIKNAKEIYEGEKPIETLGVHVLNDKEFDITLASPSSEFLYLLSVPLFYPLPKEYDPVAPYYISCGPYRLKEWRLDQSIVLEKNKKYWDCDNKFLADPRNDLNSANSSNELAQELKFILVTDEQTQLDMFERGELDFCGSPLLSFSGSDAETHLKAKGRLNYAPEATTWILVLNTKRAPLNNQKVRLALSLALNRQEMIDHNIFNGQAAYSFVPPILQRKVTNGLVKESLSLAKKLLEEGCAEIGITPDEIGPLVFVHTAKCGFRRRAQVLQQQWKQALGIDIQLQTLEWKVLSDKLARGEFDIGSASWVADIPDPSNFLQLYRALNTGRNYPQWENQEFSELFYEALNTQEERYRNDLYLQAETILMKEMPIIPLSHPVSPFVVSKRFKGYYINPMGYLDLKWAYIDSAKD